MTPPPPKLSKKPLIYIAAPIRIGDQFVNARTAMEVAITLDLAELTIRSGLFRKETRGHHFRPDYPETSETPQHTLVVKKDQKLVVTYKPVRKLK